MQIKIKSSWIWIFFGYIMNVVLHFLSNIWFLNSQLLCVCFQSVYSEELLKLSPTAWTSLSNAYTPLLQNNLAITKFTQFPRNLSGNFSDNWRSIPTSQPYSALYQHSYPNWIDKYISPSPNSPTMPALPHKLQSTGNLK